MTSLLLHALILVVFSLLSTTVSRQLPSLVLTSPPLADQVLETPLPQEFQFDPREHDEIGASALGGLEEGAAPAAIALPEVVQVPSPALDVHDVGLVEARQFVDATTAHDADLNQVVKGAAGVGVAGAEGAVDRITHEILLSLDDRPTLVVWFFDRSGSLQAQREAVNQRFQRVYEELGVAERAQHRQVPRSTGDANAPLLTSVVAFGADVQFLLDKPTADLERIQQVVAGIELDESGSEQVFHAVHAAAMRFKKYRTEGSRNVMFVAFTDEAGDDQGELDRTVDLCRRLTIPVYVVGVPAPFGRRETYVKWVDPDPSYDQTPDWGRVDQGPESLQLELIPTAFAGPPEEAPVIDSGFGPFALTRLCYETGGIYFTVHPNRQMGRRVSRRETDVYSAHFSRFFDPEAMRRYRPEYLSAQEYQQRLQQSPLRSALVRAAESSMLYDLENPRQRFVVRNEAALASDLTEAQKLAARLEPAFAQLLEILRTGESARPREIVPRWQAGYDLAMGRVLASKVRAEGYNGMLAKAKRGMKFADGNNNTWVLEPAQEISVGSRIERDAEQARSYLERVMREHPQTPWAFLAEQELARPLGWTWKESHTPIEPPANQVASNNNNPNPAPANDQPVMLPPPVKKRPPPKL